jgi:hypothetical protein
MDEERAPAGAFFMALLQGAPQVDIQWQAPLYHGG